MYTANKEKVLNLGAKNYPFGAWAPIDYFVYF